jgi:DNA-binding response OmpR family regulator
MRILVIEDDTFLRKAYEISLRHHGFQVSLAVDGETGLRMAELMQPDAMLVDVLLPMLTGLEVLRRMKANLRTAGIPVIVFSASCESEEVRSILQMGAAAYFSKSETDLSELAGRIRALLGTADRSR